MLMPVLLLRCCYGIIPSRESIARCTCMLAGEHEDLPHPERNVAAVGRSRVPSRPETRPSGDRLCLMVIPRVVAFWSCRIIPFWAHERKFPFRYGFWTHHMGTHRSARRATRRSSFITKCLYPFMYIFFVIVVDQSDCWRHTGGRKTTRRVITYQSIPYIFSRSERLNERSFDRRGQARRG